MNSFRSNSKTLKGTKKVERPTEIPQTILLLYLSGQNVSGANKYNESEKAFVKTKECVWCQKKDYFYIYFFILVASEGLYYSLHIFMLLQ